MTAAIAATRANPIHEVDEEDGDDACLPAEAVSTRTPYRYQFVISEFNPSPVRSMSPERQRTPPDLAIDTLCEFFEYRPGTPRSRGPWALRMTGSHRRAKEAEPRTAPRVVLRDQSGTGKR